MSYKDLITAYKAGVQFPDVSAMEHMDMLMTRSEIASNELHLSDEERRRVLNADRLLLQQAEQFYASIQDMPIYPVGGVTRACRRHIGGGIST